MMNLLLPIRKCFFLASCLIAINANGQQALRWYPAGNDSQQYIGISGTLQGWARYMDLNEGSLVNGKEKQNLTDVSIRRYRIKVAGQLSAKSGFVLQFGGNNINNTSQKNNGIKLLDAYVEHQFGKFLGIGVGKSAWAGLSRYAAPATGSAIGHDINYSATPFLNVYDDLFRRLGVFAKGQAGKWDYRLVLAQPPASAKNNQLYEDYAQPVNANPALQWSGYLKYQFLDRESNASAFSPATYLGKKHMLNLGIGIFQQPEATWGMEQADTIAYDARSVAIDLFCEQPLYNGMFTVYMAYLHHQLGRGFVRSVGVNNPAKGGLSTLPFNASGNTMPVSGTGNIAYLQLAYLFEHKRDQGETLRWQPYFSCQYSKLDAIPNVFMVYTGGLNYYINQQNAKLTLGYENRPSFDMVSESIQKIDRKAMLVIQYQLRF